MYKLSIPISLYHNLCDSKKYIDSVALKMSIGIITYSVICIHETITLFSGVNNRLPDIRGKLHQLNMFRTPTLSNYGIFCKGADFIPISTISVNLVLDSKVL